MNSLTRNAIALKYRQSVVVDTTTKVTWKPETITFAMELLQLGFVVTKDLLHALNSLSPKKLKDVLDDTVTALRQAKGADVEYRPMYPNFPRQVAEASDIELFVNAIFHYWTGGSFLPSYEKLPRPYAEEPRNLRDIGVISSDEFKTIFTQLLSSNESLSDYDKSVILWGIDNGYVQTFTGEIPFKENLCFVASELLKRGTSIKSFVSTATDVLRIVVALNGGDISLGRDTTFKSLPRRMRRILVEALEDVANEEDINRHRGQWVVLFHNLHVGDFSPKLYQIAKKFRNNEKIVTFNSRVHKALREKDVQVAIDLLVQRPGEFARRFDHLLRLHPTKQDVVINAFKSIADELNTRILLQLMGHFQTRDKIIDTRVAFPKGNVQKALLIEGTIEPLDSDKVVQILTIIRSTLLNRFSSLDKLGKVWIDPILRECPVPTQQRSATEGLIQVARGTRLPFGTDNQNTLRFFIYWIGQDVDLSATVHDSNFKYLDHVSYTHLYSNFGGYHSGDIVRAPHGASEFIDIDIEQTLENGGRYVAMNVLSFSCINFSDMEKCYAGWMTRKYPNSNEIFEPTTVEQKIDVRTKSITTIPVIFDLEERKAIWADLVLNYDRPYPNNVETHRTSIEHVFNALLRIDNKVSLYELFSLHALARGHIATSPEEADTVFSLHDAQDILRINSEFIV